MPDFSSSLLLFPVDPGRDRFSKDTLVGGALGTALGGALGNAQIRKNLEKSWPGQAGRAAPYLD